MMILKGEAFAGKSIDISSFAKGIYLVEISGKNSLKPSMVKIIKE